MKYSILSWFSRCFLLVSAVLLTACATPKYSYDKEDAGTIFLSLTSNFAMSEEMVNWQIVFEAIDEKARKELPSFGINTSTRIYGWAGKPEQQFKILDLDKFGNVMQSTKIAPGRYKISVINRQEKLIKNNLPYPFEEMLSNETNADSIFPIIKIGSRKKFSNIEFTIEPGKAVYLGSFNAGKFECVKELGLFQSCKRFEIVIKDEYKRDSLILQEQLSKQANLSKLEFVNRVLKIDRSKSPFLFSEL